MKKVSFLSPTNPSFSGWKRKKNTPPTPQKKPNKNNFHFWINSLEPVFQNMSDWWIKSKNQKKNILSLVFLMILKHEKQTDLETWRASYRNLCILYVHITVFNVFIVFSPFYISDLTTCYDVVCPADGDISGFSLGSVCMWIWYWCLSDQSCLNKKKMTQNQQHHFDPGLKFRSDVFKKLAHHSYNLSHKHCGIGWIEGITEILKYILHNI